MPLKRWNKKTGAFPMNKARDHELTDIDELLSNQPFVTAPDGFTNRVMASVSTTSRMDLPCKHRDAAWGASLIAAGCIILVLTLTPAGRGTMNAMDSSAKPLISITKSMEMIYGEFNKITHWLSTPIQNIQNMRLGGDDLEL